MNLLIFIHSLHSGGAERVTANLANHWVQKGWHVSVVTLSDSANDFYQLNPAIKRIALDLAGGSESTLAAVRNNLLRVRALRQVLKRVQPDVALALMSTANILLALAAIGLKGVAAVGSERTYPPRIPLGRVWEALRAHLYGRLRAVVALTDESAIWLHQHTSARRISVIQNPVSWPLPEQLPRLPVPERATDQRILLAVGRLSEEKGFSNLIGAFQRLSPDFPNWQLMILGDGPDRPALQAQITAAGLVHRVILSGRAGNVGEWYAAADLYALSSRFEGFPNALVEAMAHGLPAVCFDCDTGPRDIIRHKVDGLLVPVGDNEAFEASLRHLMSDRQLRERFGVKAVEVRERFSMELVASMWEHLFEELVLKNQARYLR